MKDYIEVNNKITRSNIECFDDSADKKAMRDRCSEEFELFSKYVDKEKNILDIGCRNGAWMEYLIEQEYEYPVGIDTTPEVIQLCKDKGLIVFEHDAHDLSAFYEGEYDAVSIIHTLEHCPNPSKVINEIHRILDTDGILFVEVPIQKQEAPELWGHFHCFTSEDEVIKLISSKFSILEIQRMTSPSKKPWFRLIAKKEK